MVRGSKPSWVKDLARKRIGKLLSMAEELSKKKPERSERYVELARKISSKYNVPMSEALSGWKKRVCKKCGAFWVPGKNVKVRANPRTKAMEYKCLNCGYIKRFSYAKPKR